MKVYWRSHRKIKGELFGRFIAWWTFGKYKHTSLVFEYEDGSLIGWHSTTKYGVHSFETETIGGKNIDVKEIPVTSVQAVRMLRLAESVDGAGYDYAGIWGHFRRAKRENPIKFYCTELAAWLCQGVGLWVLDRAAWSITPVSGHASPILIDRPDL